MVMPVMLRPSANATASFEGGIRFAWRRLALSPAIEVRSTVELYGRDPKLSLVCSRIRCTVRTGPAILSRPCCLGQITKILQRHAPHWSAWVGGASLAHTSRERLKSENRKIDETSMTRSTMMIPGPRLGTGSLSSCSFVAIKAHRNAGQKV